MADDTPAQRAERHGSMLGVRVTLPDGQVLETSDEGEPLGFVDPGDLPPEPTSAPPS